jgi:ABC-type nitrate/sulfonate/bicarbonate transport system substrate-binding protein
MKRILVHIGFAVLVLSLIPYARVAPNEHRKKNIHQDHLQRLTASNAPVWVGSDQNLYEKYGLAVEVVHGRGATPIQALAGGAVQLGHFAGASVIAANLGGSDLVFVGAQSNYVVLSIWTRTDSPIKTLSGLAGRSIGVSAPGSATHTTTRGGTEKGRRGR